MRLRAITLADVRQFTRPVRVAGIGDGLNVLTAPNESGKSTLFDAIHAVFFIPHRSQKIAPLRPAVGGNPEITLDLEHQGAVCRLHKRWGRGKSAEVRQDGRVIAKGDEAEAWIGALTQPAEEGGPAGLLWVRQGLVALDEESAPEKRHSLTARRDLLSSVTGEFEALTGGKRMDRALTRAREDLGRLETQRGAKAGGPLERAQRTVERLQEAQVDLDRRSDQLRAALEQRRTARRELAVLDDPDEAQSRTERVLQARAAFQAAERHSQALTAAAARQQQAQSDKHGTEQRVTERAHLAEAVTATYAQLETAAQSATQARARHDDARQALDAAQADLVTARANRRAADDALQTGLRDAARATEAAQRRARAATLAEAEALVATLPDLRTRAATGPDGQLVEAIDAALSDVTVARAKASAAAPRVTLDYTDGAAPVTHAGQPLPGGTPVAMPGRSELLLPGIGRLTLDPGGGDEGADRLARFEARLQELLRRAQASDAADARAMARTRADAEAALRDAQRLLHRLAPDGIDALRAVVASDSHEPDSAPPDLNALQAAADAARTGAEAAETTLEAARRHAEAAQEAALRSDLARQGLAQRHDDLAARLADQPARAELDAALNAACAALETASDAHRALAADAPDLAASRAALARAEDVERRARDEGGRLRVTLAGLDATIEAQSGDGIEEDRADTALQLARAQADLAARTHEVAVLRCLIAALEQAQASARDRYFAPVLAELRPMLRLLWPDAELRFDGDNLLPDALIRGGVADPIGTLSGGTREQIALLVRLAFARLLARSGQHTPVILDDALVYSDDDRIEQMFTALYAQADDLQILVLSCRSRALRALGGQALRFEPALDAPMIEGG